MGPDGLGDGGDDSDGKTDEPDSEPVDCDAPRPSAGHNPCVDGLLPGTEGSCELVFGGVTRSFLVYAPESLNPCVPASMVIDAHGASETARQQAGLDQFGQWPNGLGSGFRLVADREGFVVVTPQGVSNQWGTGDTSFVTAVLDAVEGMLDVDPKRVYLSGISNGGFLSYWTGCESTERIRGLAPVAGSLNTTCDAAGPPTPLIAFHAVGDTLVSYNGGRAAAQAWATRNNCVGAPSSSMTFGDSDGGPAVCLDQQGGGFSLVACSANSPITSCESWTQCDDDVEVAFCTVAAAAQPLGGHILYFNDTMLSLAAVAWEFWSQN